MKLSEMGSWLEREFEKATDSLKTQVNTHSLNFIRTVSSITPVDTSKAVSNWRLSVSPISGDIGAHALGRRGATASQSRGVVLSLAQAQLQIRHAGETIYILNHTPYIGDLNNGSSRQAGAGFVTKAIDDFFSDLGTVA